MASGYSSGLSCAAPKRQQRRRFAPAWPDAMPTLVPNSGLGRQRLRKKVRLHVSDSSVPVLAAQPPNITALSTCARNVATRRPVAPAFPYTSATLAPPGSADWLCLHLRRRRDVPLAASDPVSCRRIFQATFPPSLIMPAALVNAVARPPLRGGSTPTQSAPPRRPPLTAPRFSAFTAIASCHLSRQRRRGSR